MSTSPKTTGRGQHSTQDSFSLKTQSPLRGWLESQQQVFLGNASRFLIRLLVVLGFVSSSYCLGWAHLHLKAGKFPPILWLSFPALGAGLWLYGRYLQQVLSTTNLMRWVMLIPFAFFLGTLRNIDTTSWAWLTLMALITVMAGSVVFHLMLSEQKERSAQWKQVVIDGVALGLFTVQFGMDSRLFASLVALFPILLLVVFYNFILERDRLFRAKALIFGEPAPWLRTAYRLLPSSTYLFFLLPALLFTEAMFFNSIYELPKTQVTRKVSRGRRVPGLRKKPIRKVKRGDTLLKPTLLDWVKFSVTIKMRARHTDPALDKPTATGGVEYLEVGGGITYTAIIIRAFLVFFYAKRILLIFLMLMDSTYGIRVHRKGELEGREDATPMLNEHRNIVLRTIDSFPRTWAGMLLSGIQGRHGYLDPIGSAIHGILWIKNDFLPRLLPKVFGEPRPPQESLELRLLREESIELIGQMQDRAWVLDSFVDMVSPAHSQTFRGTLLRLNNNRFLGPITRMFVVQPEPQVRARIVLEIAEVIERSVLSGQNVDLLTDSETDFLTAEQLWELRDRALQVLEALLKDPERTVRLSAAKAIAKVAALPRSHREEEGAVWSRVAHDLGNSLRSLEIGLEEHEELERLRLEAEKQATKTDNNDNTTADKAESEELVEPTGPTLKTHDPFLAFQHPTHRGELDAVLWALGQLGTREGVEQLLHCLKRENLPRVMVLHVLGQGGRGSGRPNSGFEQASQFLQQTARDTDVSEERSEALQSLVRLAYPLPIAEIYDPMQAIRTNLTEEYNELGELTLQLSGLEEAWEQSEDPTQADKEQITDAYQQLRDRTKAYEEDARAALYVLHDTFWNLLHYNASVYVAAYLQQDEIPPGPELTDLMRKLSFEDPQGWHEFFANLPVEMDETSWVRDFHQYNRWAFASEDEQPSMVQRFQDLFDTLKRKSLSGGDESESRDEIRELLERYDGFLSDCLLQFANCLSVRPRITVRATDRGGNLSYWKLTLAGLWPWITELPQAPEEMESDTELELEFAAYLPMKLAPVAEVEWDFEPTAAILEQGHSPSLRLWSYCFVRAQQQLMRPLGVGEERGYWRFRSRTGPFEQWQQRLQQLESRDDTRKLAELDLPYLEDRSFNSIRQVFSRSRLREQEPLMIERDMAQKLDNFLRQDRRELADAPSIFLMSGEAGVGKTTLLLRYARALLRKGNSDHKAPLMLLLDAGLLDEGEDFARWMYEELQIATDPQAFADNNELSPILEVLKHVDRVLQESHSSQQLVLMVDGFHEVPGYGIHLFAKALRLAYQARTQYPWCKFILSTRRSYLNSQLLDSTMTKFVKHGQFRPKEELFYREQGGLHGVMMELAPFGDAREKGGAQGASELSKAYHRYFGFTDTSGRPRYRPHTRDPEQLDRFAMTRTLLSKPALMPVILETYHERELPHDLDLMSLFSEYLARFDAPERELMEALTRRMLYGQAEATPLPSSWTSDALLEESALLEEAEMRAFFEPFKYDRRIYEDLRARGTLIRRWRLPRQASEGSSAPVRHVSFTSLQLQEYLLFLELWRIAPSWEEETLLKGFTFGKGCQSVESPEKDPVGWLLMLAEHTSTFRPLEGALELFLLQLIEEGHHQAIADFIDRSREDNSRNRNLLYGAMLNLDPRSIVQSDGLFSIFLDEISERDLLLLRDLGHYFSTRRNLEEAEELYKLALDHEPSAQQLAKFPEQMTDLLLKRADNRRKLIEQQLGGLNDRERREYKEGLQLYTNALETVKETTQSPLLQARVLRFQALYQQNADLESAVDALEQAWSLVTSPEAGKEAQQHIDLAWIRHLQSSQLRRQVELAGDKVDEKEREARLRLSREHGLEALKRAHSSVSDEKTELLAMAYDNLGRVFHQLASRLPEGEERQQSLQQVIEYFDGSLRAKRSLNDFLGMAMSHSGIGSTYMELARLRKEGSVPSMYEWRQARSQLEQALEINRVQLKSQFGIGLTERALADLFFLHPEYKTEGLFKLTDALIAFGLIQHQSLCMDIIQQLVKELATLPVQELRKVLTQIVQELKRATDLGEWVLKALLTECKNVLSGRLPRFLTDLFSNLNK